MVGQLVEIGSIASPEYARMRRDSATGTASAPDPTDEAFQVASKVVENIVDSVTAEKAAEAVAAPGRRDSC